MEFFKYPSLTNHYKRSDINKIFEQSDAYLSEDTTWVVTEKGHGCNIAVQVLVKDGTIIRCSRNQQCSHTFNKLNEALTEDVLKRIRDVAFKVFCLKPYSEAVWIYGELMGLGVQKGVNYTPGRVFMVFDICFKEADCGVRHFLPIQEVNTLCEENNLFYAKPLHIGTFEECFEYNHEFQSTIASDLGNDYKDNTCEGTVIRPYNLLIEHDERTKFPVIKKKGEAFKEKARKKSNKDQSSPKVVPTEYLKAIELGNSMVCENRLNSAESKLGRLEDYKQIPEFMKELSEDIWNDLRTEDGFDWLTDGDRKEIIKPLNANIVKLIKAKIQEYQASVSVIS